MSNTPEYSLSPLNLFNWISENKECLKPPVGNKDIWICRDFMVTIVGGPNRRKDYHRNPTEEFFYQIKGEITLRTIQAGKRVDVFIKEGDVFLLAPNTLHSPRRPADTIGLVIETKQTGGREDGFSWFCEKCDHHLWTTDRLVESIVTDLPPIFKEFYSDPKKFTCQKCGEIQKQ